MSTVSDTLVSLAVFAASFVQVNCLKSVWFLLIVDDSYPAAGTHFCSDALGSDNALSGGFNYLSVSFLCLKKGQ